MPQCLGLVVSDIGHIGRGGKGQPTPVEVGYWLDPGKGGRHLRQCPTDIESGGAGVGVTF